MVRPKTSSRFLEPCTACLLAAALHSSARFTTTADTTALEALYYTNLFTSSLTPAKQSPASVPFASASSRVSSIRPPTVPPFARFGNELYHARCRLACRRQVLAMAHGWSGQLIRPMMIDTREKSRILNGGVRPFGRSPSTTPQDGLNRGCLSSPGQLSLGPMKPH